MFMKLCAKAPVLTVIPTSSSAASERRMEALSCPVADQVPATSRGAVRPMTVAPRDCLLWPAPNPAIARLQSRRFRPMVRARTKH